MASARSSGAMPAPPKVEGYPPQEQQLGTPEQKLEWALATALRAEASGLRPPSFGMTDGI